MAPRSLYFTAYIEETGAAGARRCTTMPVWQTLAIATLLLLGAITTGGSARSALIPQDDVIFGDNAVIFDTSTGLEWLNLRFSANLSAVEVIEQSEPGEKFSGFRYATAQELGKLLRDFFSTQFTCCFVNLDFAKTIEFVNLFGPTHTSDGLPFLLGFHSPSFDSDVICERRIFYQSDEVGGPYGAMDSDCSRSVSSKLSGSFLVRDDRQSIPEPESITLLCAGLLALLILKRKAKL
jgi:hypothetical protein